jgi:hypothetical protein
VVEDVDAVVVVDFLFDAALPDLPFADVVDFADFPDTVDFVDLPDTVDFAEVPFTGLLPFGEFTLGELFAPVGACTVTLGGLDVAFWPAACTNELPARTAASRANVRNIVMDTPSKALPYSRAMPEGSLRYLYVKTATYPRVPISHSGAP